MTDRKRIVLQPEYVKKFACDGQNCEDNCCKGLWNIYVDEEHYKKVRKVNDKDLKDKIQKYIRRNRSNPTKETYGKIHQDRELRQCIFLTEDNLCDMQMKLGADYLCNVCMIYPRYMNLIDGKYERSLTMACPLAAKEALLNPEPMAFEQFEESQETRTIINNPRFDAEGHLFLNKPQRYFWDIRIFSLSLLQNRDYDLGERLIILGIVYKKIEELHEEERIQDLPCMLEDMANMIEAGDFREQLDKITPNIQIQMQLAKEMTDRKVAQGLISDRYLECLKETLLGIGYIEGEKFENILEKYDNNYKEYLAPYLEEKEYILENYLVNEYFKEMMPFGTFKTMWDSYIFLCVLYSMVKLHLIGIAGCHKELNDNLTLKLIQSFSKEVLHNNQYIQGIIKLLKDSGYDSLAYMTILVKN